MVTALHMPRAFCRHLKLIPSTSDLKKTCPLGYLESALTVTEKGENQGQLLVSLTWARIELHRILSTLNAHHGKLNNFY